MTLYHAVAWCDRTFTAQFEVEAENPEAALAKTKTQVHDEPAEECDSGYPWDTFLINGAQGNRVAAEEPHDIASERDGLKIQIDTMRRISSAREGNLKRVFDERERLTVQVARLLSLLKRCEEFLDYEARGRGALLGDIETVLAKHKPEGTKAQPKPAIPQRISHALESIMTYLAEERKDYEQCSEAERSHHIYSDVLALQEWLTPGGIVPKLDAVAVDKTGDNSDLVAGAGFGPLSVRISGIIDDHATEPHLYSLSEATKDILALIKSCQS